MNFATLTKNKKIVVWGWWQGKNLGDMWILECIKKRFPGITPITTEIDNFDEYDFIIIGGGGLLNGPKLREPFNKKISIKYGAFGLGGEFEIKEKNELKKFINFSTFFGVRDNRNMNTYKIENNRRMEISGDCTFLYPLSKLNPQPKISKIKLIWRDPYGLMKWNRSKHHKDDGEELNNLFKNHIGNIPFDDNNKCLEFYMNILKEHGTVIFDNYRVFNFKIEDIYNKFKGVDLIVSMRYHGIVAAIQLGIPCIGLDIYPKVRTLMNECGLERYCIKLGQFDRIDSLIADIKLDWNRIRQKMDNYTKNQFLLTNKFANKIEKKMIYLMKLDNKKNKLNNKK